MTQNEANCRELSRIPANSRQFLTEKSASFDQGDGDGTTLGAPRLVFSLKKNWAHTAGTKKVTTATGKRLAKGHHMVPIHRYLGSSSDASEYLFDLEVDEVRRF